MDVSPAVLLVAPASTPSEPPTAFFLFVRCSPIVRLRCPTSKHRPPSDCTSVTTGPAHVPPNAGASCPEEALDYRRAHAQRENTVKSEMERKRGAGWAMRVSVCLERYAVPCCELQVSGTGIRESGSEGVGDIKGTRPCSLSVRNSSEFHFQWT